MDIGLKGKRALVTGSTAGIGFATAHALAAEVPLIRVNGRTMERVDAALKGLRQVIGDVKVDGISECRSTKAGRETFLGQLPDVDVLVNNIGIFEPKPFNEIPGEDWMQFFETNDHRGVRLLRHNVKGMRSRNRGRIVFVSSQFELQIPTEMVHYRVTKTAHFAVARGLAEALSSTAVTVNSVLPGPTASECVGGFVTQMAKNRGVDVTTVEEEFFANPRPSSLLLRFDTTDETAAMTAYVSSAQASATTGAALRVGGGVVRTFA